MSDTGEIGLEPSRAGAEALDRLWRSRLGKSFSYLSDVLAARSPGAAPILDSARARLAVGPASPWLSCLYSKLVAELTRPERPPLDWILEAIREATARDDDASIVVLDGESAPDRWWEHFRQLMDTDRELPFHPSAASPSEAADCTEEIAGARALLARLDPEFGAELDALLRIVVLGAPASVDPSDGYGACSTFFMPRAVLLNAAVRKSPIAMLDTLVHEASHIMLFGLSAEQPLTTNGGDVRYRSAARADLRPVDGIFHACFVTTRVHLALGRLLATGGLSEADSVVAERRMSTNASIARDSLPTLEGHACTTPVGRRVLHALAGYWRVRSPEIAHELHA